MNRISYRPQVIRNKFCICKNKLDKEILSIPIYVFAFENKIDEAFEILQIMLDGYEEWINSATKEIYCGLCKTKEKERVYGKTKERKS